MDDHIICISYYFMTNNKNTLRPLLTITYPKYTIKIILLFNQEESLMTFVQKAYKKKYTFCSTFIA